MRHGKQRSTQVSVIVPVAERLQVSEENCAGTGTGIGARARAWATVAGSEKVPLLPMHMLTLLALTVVVTLHATCLG